MSAVVCEVDGGGAVPPSGPQVAACLRAVSAVLTEVADSRCWSMSDVEVADAVQVAIAVRAQAEELMMRVVAAAATRDVPGARGATSTAAWLASTQRLSRRDAAAVARLGEALDQRYEQTRQQVATGRVRTEQAHVIARALDELAGSLSADDLMAAEKWLLEQAQTYGPDELAQLGRRVWEYLDPEAAERHEGALLAAAERRADELTRLSMRRRGDGTTSGSFRLPDLHADMLRTALEALSSPRRHIDAATSANGQVGSASGDEAAGRGGEHARHSSRAAPDLAAGTDLVGTPGMRTDVDGHVDEHADVATAADPEVTRELRPYPVRMGQAFGELIEHLPVDQLPQAGGVAATITVTVDYDRLADQVGAATTSTGTRMSAAQARRLACNTGILPAVLGGDSVCLDLGRTRRLHSRHQRIAIGLTQGGCVWPGCDRPPAWSEIHHLRPWSKGGDTDLNAAMLCPRHHHLVHRDWQIRLGADHIPEVLPPPHLDPDRTPQRHHRFRHRQPVVTRGAGHLPLDHPASPCSSG